MTFIIILAVLAGVYVGCSVIERKSLKKPVTAHATPEQLAEADELAGLSNAAQRIVHQYRALPVELQLDDVLPMVKALDLKYGVSEVNSHFTVARYSDKELDSMLKDYIASFYDNNRRYPSQQYLFSWSGSKGDCQHQDGCEYPEYAAMHDAMTKALDAKREQDRALEIAGVQHDLDAVETIINRFRTETTVMKEVTKELS